MRGHDTKVIGSSARNRSRPLTGYDTAIMVWDAYSSSRGVVYARRGVLRGGTLRATYTGMNTEPKCDAAGNKFTKCTDHRGETVYTTHGYMGVRWSTGEYGVFVFPPEMSWGRRIVQRELATWE